MKNNEVLHELEKIKDQVNHLINNFKLSSHDIGDTNKNLIHSSDHINETLKTGRDEIWACIPNFKNYMVSNLGRVKRVTKGNGTKVGKILTPFLTGPKIHKIVNGRSVIDKDYRRPTVSLCQDGRYDISVTKLMASAFANTIIVRENKIVPSTRDLIHMEKTKMIIEKIDKMKPATFNNLKFNYIPRGERHPNHKLSNEMVHLIRSNLDSTFKDFMVEYSHRFPSVSLQTLRNVFIGDSWRVRTEPIRRMTNPEENFPNGELYNFINVEHIMNSPQI
jgi:hypothetical protein